MAGAGPHAPNESTHAISTVEIVRFTFVTAFHRVHAGAVRGVGSGAGSTIRAVATVVNAL